MTGREFKTCLIHLLTCAVLFFMAVALLSALSWAYDGKPPLFGQWMITGLYGMAMCRAVFRAMRN